MKETTETLRQKLAEASHEKQSLSTEIKQLKERLGHLDNELSEARKQSSQIGNWLSGIGIPSFVKIKDGYPIYLDIISRLMYLASKMNLQKEDEKCPDQF